MLSAQSMKKSKVCASRKLNVRPGLLSMFQFTLCFSTTDILFLWLDSPLMQTLEASNVRALQRTQGVSGFQRFLHAASSSIH